MTPMSGRGDASGGAISDRTGPAPGEAPLVAPNAAALLRRNRDRFGDRPAVRFGERTWTWAEYFDQSCRFANFVDAHLDRARPPHFAVLLDNTPDYLFAFGGAGLRGAAVVGLNHTRREEHLVRDITHTDCQFVIVEPRHVALLGDALADVSVPVFVTRRFADDNDPDVGVGTDLDDVLMAYDAVDLGLEPAIDSIWALIFTSGTSDAPKAVICSQRRLLVTGNRMAMLMGLSPADTGYVCMPLFHSSSVQVGWSSSIVSGASVGLARKFSASGWLPDIRRYGATYFNYTGKPLAYIITTPERPDDGANPLRIAFGNEGAPEVVQEFARRYGVEVIDSYGATEGGVAVNRDPSTPPTALGRPPDAVKVVDDAGAARAVARFDANGRLENAEDCVGEIVNTAGRGPFEGYYKNEEATQGTVRNGWYWSGDLGYLDSDGYLYFAGRNAEWIRVDGENFPAAPIEDALRRHPDVVISSAYGVPDDQAGDQVMAGLVLRDAKAFDPVAFARWMDEQHDVGPKWRPRYVRVLLDPPTTGTNKIVKRTLVHQKYRRDRVGGDPVFVRNRGEAEYHPFTEELEEQLHDSFVHYQRERFWDL